MGIDELQAKIRKLKNPSIVALCPELSLLPPYLLAQARAELGDTLDAAAESYRRFCFAILDALVESVPAVSVESGCFFALGAAGVAAIQDVLRCAREKGYYVLLDLMRCDLPPAVDTLAESCFGELKIGDAAFTPYPCDGVILSAYLGSDGAKPFTKFCAAGKTVFLIARSSNKSAREVQDLLSGDRVVYQVMADLAMRWSGDLFGRNDYSQIGIVAGLTNAPVLRSLRQKYDRLFLLVPGFGTQGGAIRDTQYAFDRLGHGAAIMAGRSILYAYQKQGGDGTDFAEQARLAAEKMRTQILGYVTVL